MLALPARSPIAVDRSVDPAAPARTAATAPAVASPKSLWPWKWIGIGPEPLARPAHERRDRLRRRRTPIVSTTTASCAPRLDRPLVDLLEESAGRRGVPSTPKNATLIPWLAARATPRVIRPSISCRETPSAPRAEDPRSATRRRSPETPAGRAPRYRPARPGEAPDLGVQPCLEIQPERALVVGGNAREAGLDPLDPELVEPTRDLEPASGRGTTPTACSPSRRVVS